MQTPTQFQLIIKLLNFCDDLTEKNVYKETIKFHFKAMKSIIRNWFKKINKFDVNFRVMKPYILPTSNRHSNFFFLKDSFKIFI